MAAKVIDIPNLQSPSVGSILLEFINNRGNPLELCMRKGSWEFITAETCCGKVELSTTSLEKEVFDSGIAYMNGKKGDIELFFGRYRPLIFSDTSRSCRWVISNAISDLAVCNRRPLVCGMAGKY